MLKIALNECRIVFKIKTEGPLLIKQDLDSESLEKRNILNDYMRFYNVRDKKDLPSIGFVRTMRNDRVVPYIPGSSLKGVIRSYAERIARTLKGTTDGTCNPFSKIEKDKQGRAKRSSIGDDLSCSDKFILRKEYIKEDLDSYKVYRDACPICKLFGCNFLKSRIEIPDGYSDYTSAPTYSNQFVRLPRRHGVGIDRFTSSAKSGVLFNYEVEEENKVFSFNDIFLTTFELWQLGLLGYIFDDFKDQIVKLGFGKSRGLGKVSGEIESISITYFGRYKPPDGKLMGVGKLINDNRYWHKDFMGTEEINLSHCPPIISNGFRHTYKFVTSGQKEALFGELKKLWSAEDDTGFINSVYTLPHEMSKDYFLENIPEDKLV